jgi:glyoxylase-like metal-dependent hydrolase (beta-lactamase superfamily II)
MKLEKVSDRVYANCEGETGGNVGIVIMEDSVAAVDGQYPVSGADFRASIKNYTPKPVTHLLLTHVHGDHVLGNQAFEDCAIVSHRRLKERMERSLADEWAPGNLEKMLEVYKKNRPERAYLYEGLRIVLPTETIEDKYTLPGLEMIHLPGHTDCTANPDHWIQAFKTLLEMDVETYVPGHGPLCGKDEFEKQLAWFEAARNKMKELIAAGASEEEAIDRARYPEFYEDTGDRFERSMRHWYKFYSKEG